MNDKVYLIGGKSYKKSILVMLASPDPPTVGALNYAPYNTKKLEIIHYVITGDGLLPQYLYFLVNSDIKFDDWYIWLDNAQICQAKDDLDTLNAHVKTGHVKKIGAATDKSLNHSGVPRPSEGFMKKYCEVGGIDKVLIEVEEKFEPLYEGVDNPLWDVELSQLEPTEFTSTGEYKLKIAADNTITIKPISSPKIMGEDEVKQLCWEAYTAKMGEIPTRELDALIADFEQWYALHKAD